MACLNIYIYLTYTFYAALKWCCKYTAQKTIIYAAYEIPSNPTKTWIHRTFRIECTLVTERRKTGKYVFAPYFIFSYTDNIELCINATYAAQFVVVWCMESNIDVKGSLTQHSITLAHNIVLVSLNNTFCTYYSMVYDFLIRKQK